MSATFKTNDANTAYKVTNPGSSGLSINTIINNTGVTVPDTFSKLTVERIPAGPALLDISGDWTNLQKTGQAVDYTGLTFTVTMTTGGTKTVTPTSINPDTWSSTEGIQTCIFSYTEDGVTVSASKSVNVVDLSKPLTLTANTAGSTVALWGTSSTPWTGSYSTDNGSTWTSYALSSSTPETITLTNAGDSVCFKGDITGNFNYNNQYLQFLMTGSIAASGNIMSMHTSTDFESLTTISYQYAFCRLFRNCTFLTTTPALPATTLASCCYYLTFRGCTSLTTAPVLPATTLASCCYQYMFYSCTSLTTAPELPAETLASGCYDSMFSGCTSLTTAPVLPATTLADNCYEEMFSGCTSLTIAPQLPATTLFYKCYSGILRNCTNLTSVPSLPATTLAENCYSVMVAGCTSLYILDTPSTGYDKAWRIPTTGTFTNTYSQIGMFYQCSGTRSNDDMPGAAGQSYTYYTQNTPV